MYRSCDNLQDALRFTGYCSWYTYASQRWTFRDTDRCDCTGPPGTGKTTTIAAAAAIWVSNKQPCWIVAQSNVGVKNIAEKLSKKTVSFKLIVSQEFLFEW
jgi:DNA replication protein DnaC